MHKQTRILGAALGAVASLFIAQSALAQPGLNPCGELQNGYGPYDFRTDKDRLSIVTGAHFTPVVEALIKGSSGYIGGDIDYTLRAIPNHPNALLAMSRLVEKVKNDKPAGANYSIECYFDRAIRFRPDDVMVRMIYTTFLTKRNRKPEAMQQLEIALPLAKDIPFTHYNIGQLYFDLKEYKLALTQAHKAMELGLTWPELREKLSTAGQWVEPPSAPAPGADAASDAAAPAASSPNKP